MKNSTSVRCCPNCGGNNVQGNNISLVAVNGDIRQYSCYRCGNVWTVVLNERNGGKKDDE